MWEAIIDRETGFRLFSREILEKIRETRVLIVGCGGNGTVADLLLRAGFTRFGLIDDDVVEDTNLNRLPFTSNAVGRPKTEAWRDYLLSVNPDAEISVWQRGIDRHDGDWFSGILAGQGWQKGDEPVDLVFLGTTDVEANLVAARCCAAAHVRMIIGPASSGGWIVGTFLHKEGDVTVEELAGFGTEGTRLEDIDYKALRPLYLKAMNYPGRADRLAPGVGRAMMRGELAARSCGIFTRMTNAAMAFEAVKNVADMYGLSLDNTSIVRLPQVQIFDPYSGCSYYYDIQRRTVGIPDWLSGEIRWEPWRDGNIAQDATGSACR